MFNTRKGEKEKKDAFHEWPKKWELFLARNEVCARHATQDTDAHETHSDRTNRCRPVIDKLCMHFCLVRWCVCHQIEDAHLIFCHMQINKLICKIIAVSNIYSWDTLSFMKMCVCVHKLAAGDACHKMCAHFAKMWLMDERTCRHCSIVRWMARAHSESSRRAC